MGDKTYLLPPAGGGVHPSHTTPLAHGCLCLGGCGRYILFSPLTFAIKEVEKHEELAA